MELSKLEILTPFINELQEWERIYSEKEEYVRRCRSNLKNAENALDVVKQKIILIKDQIKKV